MIALVAVASAAAYWFGMALPTRRLVGAIPAIEAAGMEPQVVEKLRSVREEVEAAPRSGGAWGRLGQVFHAHDLLGPAVACYEQAALLDDDDFRWPYLEALARDKLDAPTAIPAFERAASLEPADAAFYIAFGDALIQLGELDRAQARYERALRLDPASSHALYGLAQVAWQQGEVETAREHLSRAAELTPRHGEVHTLLAQIHQRNGERELARAEADLARVSVAQTRPEDPTVQAMQAEAVSSRAWTRQGVRLAEQQRYAEAESAFRRVLEIRPGNVRDHANLGGALLGQGRAEEALPHFEQAVQLMPEDVDALNGLALTLSALGRRDAAEMRAQEALRVDPNAAGPLHTLGRIRFDEGRLDEAIARYREALAADPFNAPAHSDLAVALGTQGRLDEAVPHWQRALELNRFDLASLLSLARAESQRGNHAEAIRRARDGLSLAPNSSRFVSLLAWELATAPRAADRNGAEAVTLARRVYQARPDSPEAADVLAAALAEAGNFDEAQRIARAGLDRATASGQLGIADALGSRLALYAAGQPYRQP